MQKNCNSWRKPSPHKPLRDASPGPVPATRFFDQLSFIGTPDVGCFVLETSEGIILLDCMKPFDQHRQIIQQGFWDLGLELSDLKAILITHGHWDHYGTADWFRQTYGCKLYMSETDYQFARGDTAGWTGPLPWEIYDFLDDQGTFILGDTTIHTVLTPGHTPGCLSFIFPVTDEGRPHMAAMWGGTGIPHTPADRVSYLSSALKFAKITETMGCDVEICSHPFVDMGTRRLELVRDITDGVPNPFVLGKESYKYFESTFIQLCLDAMKEQN